MTYKDAGSTEKPIPHRLSDGSIFITYPNQILVGEKYSLNGIRVEKDALSDTTIWPVEVAIQQKDYEKAALLTKNLPVSKSFSETQKLNLLADLYSFIGNEVKAQKTFNNAKFKGAKSQNKINLPNNLSSRSAKKYILDQSKNFDALLINESHIRPSHRNFTKSLLRELWDRGYRYLAMEALQEDYEALAERGHAIRGLSGYYYNDPAMVQLTNEALNLGYKVFGYDSAPKCIDNLIKEDIDCRNMREAGQAENIINFVKKEKIKGKLIVHAGYAHIAKEKLGNLTPMGKRLAETSGWKTLSIDQVSFTDKYNKSLNSPYLEAFRKINSKKGVEAEIYISNDRVPFLPEKAKEIFDLMIIPAI